MKEYAQSCFRKGINCAQAVIAYQAPQLGVDEATALRVATGFGGGMREGEVCGAVTGALMVIGLQHGMKNAGDREAKEKTYELVRTFNERFKEKHQTLRCRELLGVDITTKEGHTAAKERDLFAQVCSEYIADALRILEDLV